MIKNKTNASKDYDVCHWWYFSSKFFKYEPYLFNICHDLMQKDMNCNDSFIVYAKKRDYWTQFWYMSKDDAVDIMKDLNLNEKSGLL